MKKDSDSQLSKKHFLLYGSSAIILLKYGYSYSEKKYRSSPSAMYPSIQLQP